MTGSGILALWNDCAEGHLETYEAWYRGEHLFERLGIPGFQVGRRYENTALSPRFFTYYETETPAVLTSPGYQDRLNDPTPLTRKIMSTIFVNLSRTICERVAVHGQGHGAYVTTAKLQEVPGSGQITEIASLPTSIRLELWRASDVPAPAQSAEDKLRGGDTSINACLIGHSLREEDAVSLAESISKSLPDAEIGSYKFLCELRENEAPE